MNTHPRLSTILTLCGVLVAGTAAAAVNSSVLSDRGRPESAASASTVASSATVPTTDTSSTDSSTESTTPSSGSVEDHGAPLLFEIGDAGSVTLAIRDDGDRLRVASVDPQQGWAELDRDHDDHTVMVMMSDGSTIVTFRATVVRGVVSTEVTSAVGAGAAVPSSVDDDHSRSSSSVATDDDHGKRDHDDDD